jgi:hypothetical protein
MIEVGNPSTKEKIMDKQIEAAQRKATAEAWYQAWICQSSGSKAQDRCAAERRGATVLDDM